MTHRPHTRATDEERAAAAAWPCVCGSRMAQVECVCGGEDGYSDTAARDAEAEEMAEVRKDADEEES